MKKTNLKETLQNWKLGNYFREFYPLLSLGYLSLLPELIS